MSTVHVSVEPVTLAEVIRLATERGYTVDVTHQNEAGTPVMIDLTMPDGEHGCHEMSEEQSVEGQTHVGCMSDPQIDGLTMAAEGTEMYNLVCNGAAFDDDYGD